MQAKTLATTLGLRLKERGVTLKRGHLLNIVAGMYGLSDWNTLAARPDTPMLDEEKAMEALRGKLLEYGVPEKALSDMQQWDFPLAPVSPKTLDAFLSFFGGKPVEVFSVTPTEGVRLNPFASGDPLPLVRAILPEYDSLSLPEQLVLQGCGQMTMRRGGNAREFVDRVDKADPSLRLMKFGIHPLQLLVTSGGAELHVAAEEVRRIWDWDDDLQELAEKIVAHSKRQLTPRLPVADPRKLKVGQRLSAYPDGRHSFTVQHIMRGRGVTELITDQGLPLKVESDLYLVSPP